MSECLKPQTDGNVLVNRCTESFTVGTFDPHLGFIWALVAFIPLTRAYVEFGIFNLQFELHSFDLAGRSLG